ncbi:MAG TPA: class I SAM-dependent methyltransferase [Solirubrobacteraceae bacterium]|jgi:ubiquinone/menaquinone biosynthesis C-methylase UbiE|nr:class I SAM-dependent methyltransferase [Solirubrobacteraceae bacterium]
MTTGHSSHPLFARIYTRVAQISERRGGDAHRRKLLAGLQGRVVEVGAGSGANFRHYPTAVREVIAVEPERYLRERAEHVASQAAVAVTVAHGHDDRLPGEDESFDAGVAALVLCTVPDQRSALAELYRVIRPGGELRFYEHVVSESAWEARFQRFADATFWPRVAGGCHLARDTTAAIERAGFQIQTFERFPFSPAPFLPPDPHILGIARRA